MALYYEHQINIDSRDVDGNGHCRPSALLGHLQEAGTLAAERGGFGREVLLSQHRAFWMLARMWYRLERPLHWGEQVTIRTWHRGAKTALMYRDFDIFVGDEQVGEAVSGWVLADLDSHKLLRLGSVTVLEGTDGGALCKSKNLSKVRVPKEMELAERRKMRYSDTDINAHINNTRYADFACDAVGMENCPCDTFLTEMQLGYVAECKAGEEIDILVGSVDENHFVQGKDPEGNVRFEVQMAFKTVDQV